MRRNNTLLKRVFKILLGNWISDIIQFQCFGYQKGYLQFDSLDIGQIPRTPDSRFFLNKPDDMHVCHLNSE